MTQRLNLKFTVADTDWILKVARAGWTAEQIIDEFSRQGRTVTTAEVSSICSEQGVSLRSRQVAR